MPHVPEQKKHRELPIVYTVPEQHRSVVPRQNRAPRERSRVPHCPLRATYHSEVMRCTEVASGFPEWMDLKTTQSYVSVSDRTLREWIHREHDPLPAVQDGGKIYVSRSRLDRWMLNHPVTKALTQEVGEIVDGVMKSLAGVL